MGSAESEPDAGGGGSPHDYESCRDPRGRRVRADSPGGPVIGSRETTAENGTGGTVMNRVDAVGAVKAQLEFLSQTALRSADVLAEPAGQYARLVIDTFDRGGRLLFCGNGGSAATVEHVVTEYVIRLRRQREPLPAIALRAAHGGGQRLRLRERFRSRRSGVRPAG